MAFLVVEENKQVSEKLANLFSKKENYFQEVSRFKLKHFVFSKDTLPEKKKFYSDKKSDFKMEGFCIYFRTVPAWLNYTFSAP